MTVFKKTCRDLQWQYNGDKEKLLVAEGRQGDKPSLQIYIGSVKEMLIAIDGRMLKNKFF